MRTAGFSRRLCALVKKEFLQLGRDRSSLLLGVALPLLLILLIGYGISLDVKNVPLAVVLEDASPTARRAVRFLDGSDYFSPRYVASLQEGERLLRCREAEAILLLPPDFSRQLAHGKARAEAILYGVNTTTAMTAQSYLEAGFMALAAEQAAAYPARRAAGYVAAESRIWFNDANTSAWFFIPGLIMLIMTIVGVFLTAVVMAREWERGTFESLFVTPVEAAELILAKMIPYFCVAMAGMLLCLLAGRFLYELPMRGSLLLILGASMLYLVVALGIGLTISAVTKNQFIACQIALLVSFMPSVMLSGFLFDLHSQPLPIRVISQLFPTTYYLQMLKSLFLSGNDWPMLFKNSLVLLGYAVFFLALAGHITRKKVEA
ncbi:MAG: ABC transporter permease [Schwartzia sp. (in: firmicutes)]